MRNTVQVAARGQEREGRARDRWEGLREGVGPSVVPRNREGPRIFSALWMGKGLEIGPKPPDFSLRKSIQKCSSFEIFEHFFLWKTPKRQKKMGNMSKEKKKSAFFAHFTAPDKNFSPFLEPFKEGGEAV